LERRRLRDPNFAAGVLDVDSAALETATLTTVLASALTALDLCATAMWFWVNSAATDYVSLAEVQRKAADIGLTIPSKLQDWLNLTRGSHRYAPIKAFRDSQIHRIVRQDVTVGNTGLGRMATGITSVGADPAKPTTHDRAALVEEVADFVLERWTAFWALLP